MHPLFLPQDPMTVAQGQGFAHFKAAFVMMNSCLREKALGGEIVVPSACRKANSRNDYNITEMACALRFPNPTLALTLSSW